MPISKHFVILVTLLVLILLSSVNARFLRNGEIEIHRRNLGEVNSAERAGSKKSGDKKSGSKKSGDKKSGSKEAETQIISSNERAGDKKSGSEKKSGSKKSGSEKKSGTQNEVRTEGAGDKKSGSKKSGDKKSGSEKKSGTQNVVRTEGAGAKKSGDKKAGDKKSDSKKKSGTKNGVRTQGGAKSKKSSKGTTTVPADEQSLPVSEAALEETTLPPDLDDWIEDCGRSSSDIDDCVKTYTTQSNPLNCKTCLKSLGMSTNPPPAVPIPNGVKVCVDIGMCGKCTKQNIVDFYSCGLLVDQAYALATVPADGAVETVVPPEAPPANATPDASVREDTFNCPAVWPGDGTDCVMVDEFNRKQCVYYEYSADAICSCGVGSPNPELLIWTCVNGPETLIIEANEMATVADLVESEPAVEDSSSSSQQDKPMVTIIAGIDAQINSLP